MDTDTGIESRTIKSILYARKTNGLYASLVTGARGAGKSSYSIQVLYRVFRALGYSQEEAWKMAIDRCLYKIPEIVTFLEKAGTNEHKDIFIWDDAGVFAGGVRWLTNQHEMVLIESICDTLRDSLYGILFTVPDVRTLSRRLRNYDDYIISINYLNDKKQKELLKTTDVNDIRTVREARVYKKRILPSSAVRIYKEYYDSFDVMLPDWVYQEYKKKRHRYSQENIKQLKKHLRKQE